MACLEIGSMVTTKQQRRKTEMAKNGIEKPKKSNHGKSIKEDSAGEAMATITANIAATKISIDTIDNEPIIDNTPTMAEERVPENSPTSLVNIYPNLNRKRNISKRFSCEAELVIMTTS